MKAALTAMKAESLAEANPAVSGIGHFLFMGEGSKYFMRDAGRLIGTFDNGDLLRHWNIHAGGLNPIGRMDYWLDDGSPTSILITPDSLEARLRTEAYVMTRQSALEALGGAVEQRPAAILIADEATPAVEDSLAVFVPAALAAAEVVQLSNAAYAASAEYYTLSVASLQSVMVAAFLSEGYPATDADTLGLIAGEGVASRAAAIVADEVSTTSVDSLAQNPGIPHYDKHYYVTDHLGSIRVVFDEEGNVIEARDYYPLGLQIPDRTFVSGSQTREGFTGYELDAETGDYYGGARYYLPELGRFTATDRFQDKFPSQSPYHYAGNDPIRNVDVNADSVVVGYVEVPMIRPSGGIRNPIPELVTAYHTLVVHYDESTGQRSVLAEGMPENSPIYDTGSYLLDLINPFDNSDGFGDLQARILTDPNSLENTSVERVGIPEGLSEAEFVDAITAAFGSYDNSDGVNYELFPQGQGDGNSNSMVGSVLRTAGSDYSPRGFAPGWFVDVLNRMTGQ